MIPVQPPALVKVLAGRWLEFGIRTGEKEVFLTFDDGPVPEVTPRVLDILQTSGAKATFFCVGNNVQKHPGLFSRIMEEGHSIGNHTFHHLNGWKTPAGKYFDDVSRCRDLVPSRLFRPPYGRITPRQIGMLRNEYRIILWSVLSLDFHRDISQEQCLQIVLEHARPGSVIVFHDSLKARDKVLSALPRLLEQLTREGYRFSAIS